MVKEIPLSKGLTALIDDEDYDRVTKLTWFVQKRKNTWYAVHDFRTYKPRKVVYMHRYIIEPKNLDLCDHINGNGLDNRRCNLRVVNLRQNNLNKRKIKKKTSQFKGVTKYKRDNNWQAKITVNRKTIHLGYFNDEVEAAKIYDEAARKHFGEYALTNFTENGEINKRLIEASS